MHTVDIVKQRFVYYVPLRNNRIDRQPLKLKPFRLQDVDQLAIRVTQLIWVDSVDLK